MKESIEKWNLREYLHERISPLEKSVEESKVSLLYQRSLGNISETERNPWTHQGEILEEI